jgi:putative LysE/RhtB family amino acid efflux pump
VEVPGSPPLITARRQPDLVATLRAVTAVSLGFQLGFLVALQVGPMSLYLIRSTLAGGWSVGVAIGVGVACVDTAYAAAGAAGAASVLSVASLRIALGLAGALVLAALGARITWRATRAPTPEAAATAKSPGRALVTATIGTAANPLTIASWAAIFAAASVGAKAWIPGLLAGVGLGSLSWTVSLACLVAVRGRSLGQRARQLVDLGAGVAMIGFSIVLAIESLGQHVPTG